MQVLIKLPLAPTTDLDLVRRTIEHVNHNLVPKFSTITDGPDILGLTEEKTELLPIRFCSTPKMVNKSASNELSWLPTLPH